MPARAAPATVPRGVFVTFEGGEGAGKSTQITRLAEALRALGREVVVTREPGGSPTAEAIRAYLLSGKAEALGPEAEAVLFAAARADHVDRTIRPALARGAIVLSDRFADSTRVYQGVAGVSPTLVAGLERVALDGLAPDLTVLLDLPAEAGLARADARRGAAAVDRFEKDGLAVHEARRRAFLDLAAAEPRRFLVVPADRDVNAVATAILDGVAERLGHLIDLGEDG